MTDKIISKVAQPELHQPLDTTQNSVQTLDLLRVRRSMVAKEMNEPGPNEEQLNQLLEIACRVPDHGKLAPWRFIIFQNEARTRFGTHLASKFAMDNPDAEQQRIEFEGRRFERAPVVIAVISSVQTESKIPEWEQILSSGAACQNLLIAANAMGYAAQWLTEWYAYDDEIASILGLKSSERVAGFIYVGTPNGQSKERARPEIASKSVIGRALLLNRVH